MRVRALSIASKIAAPAGSRSIVAVCTLALVLSAGQASALQIGACQGCSAQVTSLRENKGKVGALTSYRGPQFAGIRCAAAQGKQVIFEEVVLFGPKEAGFPDPLPINRGNPYSEVIQRYLAEVSPEAAILECGGGDRRLCRPNHLNFEYLRFELADVYGDVHALPFKDDTFDLVIGHAFIHHLPVPGKAFQEASRVLKPGGRLAVAVWDRLESSPGYAAMAALLEGLFDRRIAGELHRRLHDFCPSSFSPCSSRTQGCGPRLAWSAVLGIGCCARRSSRRCERPPGGTRR